MIVFRQLLAAIGKETRLIVRDWHALAVLFVMPVAFVTIMSLALRDVFTERAGVTFSVLIVDQDGKLVGEKLRESFAKDKHFRVELATAPFPDAARVEAQLTAGLYKFALLIPAKATVQARQRALEQVRSDGRASGRTPSIGVRLLSDPTIRADHRSMLVAFTNGALRAIESRLIAERIAELARTPFGTSVVSAPLLAAPELFREVSDELESGTARNTPNPTSVQQNAPGWTLLAMFFLAIPLSVTLIKERAQGSLMRLQSMPVPAWVLFGGKIAPYLVINQLQLLLILAVGVWGLPLLGGDRLTLGNAPGAIALLSVSASLAAIGFALLIATFARTPEQATTFSATTVMILAALGGIMVPKMVMPPAMQQLAELTPFSWGLEGFLDIFIRGGGVHEIVPEVVRLLGFGAACFAFAILRFNGRLRHGQ
jgi:ABC-2 type transport system permease protein